LIHSLIRNPEADRTRYVGFRLASSKATPKLCMIPRTGKTESRKLAMSLEITTREFDRVIVVDVVGKLTTTEGRTQLRDLIHVFSETGHKRFLLNLAGVDYVDSSGMGELVRCFSTVRQKGGEMKLLQVNKKVADLLQMTRLHTIFEIYSEERVALGTFGRGA
jgi:anti-sigma B factor antagonist